MKYRPLLQRLASAHRPVPPSIPTPAENLRGDRQGGESMTGLRRSQQGLAYAPCRLGAEITGDGDVASEPELDSMAGAVQ